MPDREGAYVPQVPTLNEEFRIISPEKNTEKKLHMQSDDQSHVTLTNNPTNNPMDYILGKYSGVCILFLFWACLLSVQPAWWKVLPSAAFWTSRVVSDTWYVFSPPTRLH